MVLYIAVSVLYIFMSVNIHVAERPTFEKRTVHLGVFANVFIFTSKAEFCI